MIGTHELRTRRANRTGAWFRRLGEEELVVSESGFPSPLESEQVLTRRAVGALLVAHSNAASPRDSFLWFGRPLLAETAAWSILARSGHTGSTSSSEQRTASILPRRAGESDGAMAARLHEFASAAHLLGESDQALWLLRIRALTTGEDLVESFAALERRLARAGDPLAGAAALDRIALLLDRGRVPEARLAAARAPVPAEPALARRAQWLFGCLARLAPDVGRTGLEEPVVPEAPVIGPVPRALQELGQRLPDWVASTQARDVHLAPPRPAPAVDAASVPRLDRRALGATFACVLVRGSSRVEVLAHDVAPALGDGLEDWFRSRAMAWLQPGELEHDAALANEVVVRLAGRDDLRAALDARALAQVVVPLVHEQGDLRAWLYLELEHLLVPCARTLARCRAAWRAAPLVAACVRGEGEGGLGAHRSAAVGAVSADPDPRVALARKLAARLGAKFAHRRWMLLCADRERPDALSLVASGGAGFEGAEVSAPGQAPFVLRAWKAQGLLCFEEPAPGCSIHAGARSGWVLPLRAGGRVAGVFAVESERRRDFRPADVERAELVLADAGDSLARAEFGLWYAARPLHSCEGSRSRCLVLPDTADFERFGARLRSIATTEGPFLVLGEEGSGRSIIAHWLHFEAGASGPCAELDLQRATADGDGSLPPGLEPGATLVVRARDEDLLDHPSGRLRGLADRVLQSGARLVVLGSDGAAQGAGALGGFELRVPALRQRREEIPALVDELLQGLAVREGLVAPRLRDSAHALLWRQRWRGNVASLELALRELCVTRPGELLDGRDVEPTLEQAGLGLLARLPSLRPRRQDLVAALWTTRTSGGRINKTRAALYLGWDPATLAGRLRELGLSGGAAPEPCSWLPAR